MEFPRLVYKSASVYVLAEDQATYEMFLADGWYATVPEALEGKRTPEPVTTPTPEPLDIPAEDAPPTRDELKHKATELGIKFPRNATDEKLSALIAEALAKE